MTTQHKGELGKNMRWMTDKNQFWLRGRYFNTAWQGKARKHEVGQGKARCQGARKGKVLGRKAREGAREARHDKAPRGKAWQGKARC
jgi:hypothetical protein